MLVAKMLGSRIMDAALLICQGHETSQLFAGGSLGWALTFSHGIKSFYFIYFI